MDQHQMDLLTRRFAQAVDRRTGVRALLALGAATLGLVAAGEEETTAKAKKPQGKTKAQKGRVRAQGPCGNGGSQTNRCTKDSQCCTGDCDKKKRRCRCKHEGAPCTETRQCCSAAGQAMTCQSGTCQTQADTPTTQTADPTPPPPGCGKDGATCTRNADCCEGFACENGVCAPPAPPPPGCGKDGVVCAKNADCCEGFACEKGVFTPNICAHTCQSADNFCNVPPANQCCGGKNGCRCITTNSGPFCFGGAGFGGCEGTTSQGKVVPHCEVDADCQAVFGANSGVRCIAPSTIPSGSSCCPGGNQSACVLPCPEN